MNPHGVTTNARDTVVPGFLCKITPSGRRVFMLSYGTLAGQRRKPALSAVSRLHHFRSQPSASRCDPAAAVP